MIEFANYYNINEILFLWQQCFGDSKDYVEMFLENHDIAKTCLVYKENGIIKSMLFLLDGSTKIAGEIFGSLYIYAACTAPEARGRGLMAQLLQKSMSVAVRENKDYICLVPANESLFDYYANFGFKIGFKKKELVISRKQLIIISEQVNTHGMPSIGEITNFRNSVLTRSDCFLWDEMAVKYAISENESIGGNAVFAYKDEKLKGYALYIEKSGQAIVRELCAQNDGLSAVAGLLTVCSKADMFIINLPIYFPLTSDSYKIYNSGMIRPISARADLALASLNNAYIGLTLE